VPQAELKKLLSKVEGSGHATMDCSIMPSQKYPEFFVVSTVDFFYPLVEDPYLQGRIAACNVLSDMYSMGIDTIDNVLMTLSVSDKMMEESANGAHVVTEQMMKGFGETCKEAGTLVTGGQTIINASPIIGGVAKSVLKEEDFIRPEGAVAGDVLVLTKPLGTQLAVNMRVWQVGSDAERKQKLEGLPEGAVEQAFSIAQASMGRLNKVAARLMRAHRAHAATDVTGFGILGHAQNLAENQKASVKLVLDKLPCIRHTSQVADKCPGFKLKEGYSAETSGGLLVCLPAEEAAAYCAAIEAEEGWPAWQIGRVEAGERTAEIAAGAEVIDV